MCQSQPAYIFIYQCICHYIKYYFFSTGDVFFVCWLTCWLIVRDFFQQMFSTWVRKTIQLLFVEVLVFTMNELLLLLSHCCISRAMNLEMSSDEHWNTTKHFQHTPSSLYIYSARTFITAWPGAHSKAPTSFLILCPSSKCTEGLAFFFLPAAFHFITKTK